MLGFFVRNAFFKFYVQSNMGWMEIYVVHSIDSRPLHMATFFSKMGLFFIHLCLIPQGYNVLGNPKCCFYFFYFLMGSRVKV